jgi:nucleotide-binding universal stress UspA family protein
MSVADRGPVVVGVDGSRSALRAVRWAAAEAARHGSTLKLVTAFGWMPVTVAPAGGADLRAELTAAARDQLAAAAAAARAVAPDLAVEQVLEEGGPAAVLNAHAADARLTVIGDRGHGGFAGLLLGSVGVALAQRCPVPLVVVRGSTDDPGPAAPVVVGIDGTPTSEAALAFAVAEAVERRVPLMAVHAWQDLVFDTAVAPRIDWKAVETEERATLAERLAGWTEKHPDLDVRRVVVCDGPAHALVQRSHGARLVVVGSRGRGGIAGLLLGSVSQAVLHHADCPVVIVRD